MGKRKQLTGAALYLRYLGLTCILLALFCLGIFAVGYQPLSVGRVATTVLLIVAAPVLLVLSHKLAKRQ